MAEGRGVGESGEVVHPATGTPQGGIVSPVLANVYLHYVLDLWFERVVKKQCRGDVYKIRFADDFVCAFQFMAEAKRFERALPGRLGKFGLAVAPEKTRTLQFSRYVPEPNEAFDFLGFEFRWRKGRTGEMALKRRTSPKKFRASVKAFTEWIKKYRHSRMSLLMEKLAAKLRGYWNYYGVRGNSQSLSRFYDQCQKLLFKWLNRRSQKRSLTWVQFDALLKRYRIPTPRIV